MIDTRQQAILELARQRVANLYSHQYHINAILGGEWDGGSLVKTAIAEIEAEQEQCVEGKKK
jgi:hypothetical protein